MAKKIVHSFLDRASYILLIEVVTFIFLLPFFPVEWHRFLINVFFTMIFFTAIFVLDSWRKSMLVIAIIATVTEWISEWANMPVLNYVSLFTNILFFQIVVIRLIAQIARSRKADVRIILESINGYLMMGLMFTTWVAVAMFYDPNSFNFPMEDPNSMDFSYFAFVTMTTLGYGDITPQLDFSRSISMLISTAGQIYIAVIIAMLVGKYAGQASAKDN